MDLNNLLARLVAIDSVNPSLVTVAPGETEIAFYEKHLNEFGLPLDSRETYTKLDWQVWTATLADKAEDFQILFAPIPKWVNEGPTRVPLTDWYDTKSGKMIGFQARCEVAEPVSAIT